MVCLLYGKRRLKIRKKRSGGQRLDNIPLSSPPTRIHSKWLLNCLIIYTGHLCWIKPSVWKRVDYPCTNRRWCNVGVERWRIYPCSHIFLLQFVTSTQSLSAPWCELCWLNSCVTKLIPVETIQKIIWKWLVVKDWWRKVWEPENILHFHLLKPYHCFKKIHEWN